MKYDIFFGNLYFLRAIMSSSINNYSCLVKIPQKNHLSQIKVFGLCSFFVWLRAVFEIIGRLDHDGLQKNNRQSNTR